MGFGTVLVGGLERNKPSLRRFLANERGKHSLWGDGEWRRGGMQERRWAKTLKKKKKKRERID